MKARIIKIGNSRGIRLPKVLLEESRLAEDVELQAEPGRIVVQKAGRPRAGWAAAAQRMRQRGEDTLLDPPVPTQFEEREWKWR